MMLVAYLPLLIISNSFLVLYFRSIVSYIKTLYSSNICNLVVYRSAPIFGQIFITMLRQALVLVYFLYFPYVCMDFCFNSSFSNTQIWVFTNIIIFIKHYFFDVVRMEFCIKSNIQNTIVKPLNTIRGFIERILESYSCGIYLFACYLIGFAYGISPSYFLLYVIPFSFCILFYDLLFFYFCNNTNFIGSIFFCLCYFIIEALSFIVLSKLPIVFLFSVSVIVHVFLFLSIWLYMCKYRMLLLLQRVCALFLIFNIDTILFPSMLASSFYATYMKMVLFGTLFLRKMIFNSIYFLSLQKSLSLHSKFIIMTLSAMLCFYAYCIGYYYIIDVFKYMGICVPFYIFSPNTVNMWFLLYLNIDILLYGFSKIAILSRTSNAVLSNYLFTTINLITYIMVGLLIKLCMYLSIWPIKSIFLTAATAWHITYIFAFIILLKL